MIRTNCNTEGMGESRPPECVHTSIVNRFLLKFESLGGNSSNFIFIAKLTLGN